MCKIRAIIPENMHVLDADHVWKSGKISSSATSEFIIGNYLGCSIFISGVDWKGMHYVALWNTNVQKSTVFHHAVHLLSYLRSDTEWDMGIEEQKIIQIPIVLQSLLFETDGDPDYSTTFTNNQLYNFVLFLLHRVDEFSVIYRHLVSSFINTIERIISVLNIGLDNFTLNIEGEQWFMNNLLVRTASMQVFWNVINYYDK